jgi:hypothetical protein
VTDQKKISDLISQETFDYQPLNLDVPDLFQLNVFSQIHNQLVNRFGDNLCVDSALSIFKQNSCRALNDLALTFLSSHKKHAIGSWYSDEFNVSFLFGTESENHKYIHPADLKPETLYKLFWLLQQGHGHNFYHLGKSFADYQNEKEREYSFLFDNWTRKFPGYTEADKTLIETQSLTSKYPVSYMLKRQATLLSNSDVYVASDYQRAIIALVLNDHLTTHLTTYMQLTNSDQMHEILGQVFGQENQGTVFTEKLRNWRRDRNDEYVNELIRVCSSTGPENKQPAVDVDSAERLILQTQVATEALLDDLTERRWRKLDLT